MPTEELLTEMGKFNEELVKAGVMLAGEGLHAELEGRARPVLRATKRTVIDGPFAETKELIAGFWLLAGEVDGRGDRVGEALPRFDGGDRDRDPPGVRGGGLRRRVHARAARSREERMRAQDRRAAPADAGGTSLTWPCRSDAHRAIDAVWRIESARLIAGARADGARRRPRRGSRAGRARRGARAVARVGRPGQPGRLAHGHREAPRDRPLAPRARCSSASTRSSAASSRREQETAAPDLDAALDDDVGDDLLRLDLHGLPPGALDRGARRAHAAPARRSHDRRDRARLPRARADRRPADRPRQADARRGAGPVRGARAAPSCAARLVVGARGHLPRSSTRATRRPPATTGCGPRSARTRCASAASWPSWRREEPEVHGLVALMEIQASRSRARVGPTGEPDPAARPGPRRAGTSCSSAAASRRSSAPRSSAARSARTRCRPRSPPATRGRAPPRRRTGRASRRSTTRSRSSRRRRSWS